MKKTLLLALVALSMQTGIAAAEGTHMICADAQRTVVVASDRFGYCVKASEAICPPGTTLNADKLTCSQPATFKWDASPKAKCKMWNGPVVDQVPAGNCP